MSSSPPRSTSYKKRTRQATVYDAVAGRVSSDGFIPTAPRPSANRDTVSSTTVAVPPEEALFRRHGAPERYEEDDFYWANRHLKEGQILPDSDLLKAVHEYASEFYGRTSDGGILDFESLDETALIAIGILLEEWAGVVGGEGWRVFVEGEERNDEVEKEAVASEELVESQEDEKDRGSDDGQDDLERSERKPRKRRKDKNRPKHSDNEVTDDASPKRERKRRKLRHRSGTNN